MKVIRGEEDAKIQSLIFDNANSSTVAFFKHLAGVEKLPNHGVYALNTNADIVKYVKEHPQSVGVLGINWIAQPPGKLEADLENIKVLGIKNQKGKLGDDGYYKPTQSNLALNLYPFTRKLYCVNAQAKNAAGFEFSAFLYGERGQRLILKSGLLPEKMPSREIIIFHPAPHPKFRRVNYRLSPAPCSGGYPKSHPTRLPYPSALHRGAQGV